MRLLLDTHTVLWAWNLSLELSEASRIAIVDPDNEVFVSTVCAFELSIKFHLGKLPGAERAVRDFGMFMDRYEMVELPVSLEHGLRAGAFPMDHRDPFDRLLAAQAELDDLTLVTRDAAFADFPCRTLW